MREAVSSMILNGPVSGWETTWEAPSRQPQTRSILFEVWTSFLSFKTKKWLFGDNILSFDSIVSIFCLQRPFVCSVEDCSESYRRKDHLTRHALKHEGKLFTCHIDGCKTSFTIKSNLKRHLKDTHHHESPTSPNHKTTKEYVCPEEGCGKVFKYASKLRKHEDSHGKSLFLYRLIFDHCLIISLWDSNCEVQISTTSVKLESSEAICCECMEIFSNVDCLKAHILSSHQHATCEICGSKQLRKNLKRHLRTHEKKRSSNSEVIKCHFPECDHTFSTVSCSLIASCLFLLLIM